MGDAVHDALAAGEAGADAYFFRWQPISADRDGDALEAIRGLLRRGKLVAIQIAAAGRDALAPHRRWLHELADDDQLVRHPGAAWDAGIVDAARPFFAAAVCHRDAARIAELAAMRRYLTDLGIPVRPGLAPFQFHPGCPLLVPGSHVVLPTGRRVLCIDEAATDAAANEAGFDPRAASQARVAEQLRGACTRCSVLPFCLSRCPRLAAPVPDSPECTQIRQRAHAELRRLLASGQIRPEDAEQGSPPP
jgi:radical SAM protein with 4Fe4S-binding SPASM domain